MSINLFKDESNNCYTFKKCLLIKFQYGTDGYSNIHSTNNENEYSSKNLKTNKITLNYLNLVNLERNVLKNQINTILNFNKNTPLINYLINKRLNFCELGASSHIAAFIPDTNVIRYCLIPKWEEKNHYG